MANIYDQHAAAFKNVSAYVVITTGGDRVATVALKFPRDGAGRLYAYVHIIGTQMVRGFAGGYGYDKRSAAVADAIGKIVPTSDDREQAERIKHFREAAEAMHGNDWVRALENVNFCGYRVIQAV
jgi:hypothetical protein